MEVNIHKLRQMGRSEQVTAQMENKLRDGGISMSYSVRQRSMDYGHVIVSSTVALHLSIRGGDGVRSVPIIPEILCRSCLHRNRWNPFLKNEADPVLLWWGCPLCDERNDMHIMIDKNNLPGRKA